MSKNSHLKAAIAHLEMVDSPMSNSQAAFIEHQKLDIPHLRRSDFYMLTARPAAHFENLRHDEETSTIHFDICVGSTLRDSGALHYEEEPAYAAFEGSLNLSAGRDLIHAADTATGETIMAYTPDSILWWKSRHRPGISGLPRARELCTFDLLYVGIAKEGDSFSRLIERGHKQRGLILANEPQRFAGARVSDETYLFFFEVIPTVIKSFDPALEISDEDFDFYSPQKKYVADAEKAFVSLLKPTYNRTLYNNYPAGADGLYREGLDRYSYSIAEEMILNTPQGAIVGARGPFEGVPWSNRADIIAIEGDEAKILKSGVDFDNLEPF